MNLLNPLSWVNSGPGTITINPDTGQISMVTNGIRTAVTQVVPTEIGAAYRLTYHTVTADAVASPAGSSAQTPSDYVLDFLRTPAPGDHGFDFTATTTTTYVGFARVPSGTPTVSSPTLEKVPAGAPKARRLNGTSQYFTLDVSAAGLRTANHTWFIGGWVRFTYMPTAGVYLLDFGDPAAAGGAGRNRLIYDPVTPKLFCSSSALNGTSYRECAHNVTLQKDVWYHIGMMCFAAGDIQLMFNGEPVGTKTGSITPYIETLCKRLTIGARTGASVTNHSPVRCGDWLWSSNSLPTYAQVEQLAQMKRPNAVSGFTPTYWWAFDQTSTTEPSLGATATLTASGAPTTVVGPMVIDEPPPVVVSAAPLDFIFI
jgi:hypothetical protein